jgi:hypothetical protein
MNEKDKRFYGDPNCEHEWTGSKMKKCRACKHDKYLMTCRKCGLKYVVKAQEYEEIING